MQLEKNKALSDLNTFGFNATAELFVEARSISDAQEAIEYCKQHGYSLTILGDGSNVVLAGDIPGLTLKMATTTFSIDREAGNIRGSDAEQTVTTNNRNKVSVVAEAGVNWHQFVLATIEQKAFGLENLSLIPGTVGAAPIQNIGAYGVEVASSLAFVECIDCQSNQLQVFDNAGCEFAYRDSLFKRSTPIRHTNSENQSPYLLPQFLITRVGFCLQSEFKPQLSYAALANEINKGKIDNPDASTVSNLVCQIRRSKLPDPALLGNAGSFFKNPIIDHVQKENILSRWPAAPLYPQADGSSKIAAGWMVEKAGWKGKTVDDGKLGVHEHQALVLVNHGGGDGRGLLALADDIRLSVKEMFGVELEQEPRNLPTPQTV